MKQEGVGRRGDVVICRGRANRLQNAGNHLVPHLFISLIFFAIFVYVLAFGCSIGGGSMRVDAKMREK